MLKDGRPGWQIRCGKTSDGPEVRRTGSRAQAMSDPRSAAGHFHRGLHRTTAQATPGPRLPAVIAEEIIGPQIQLPPVISRTERVPQRRRDRTERIGWFRAGSAAGTVRAVRSVRSSRPGAAGRTRCPATVGCRYWTVPGRTVADNSCAAARRGQISCLRSRAATVCTRGDRLTRRLTGPLPRNRQPEQSS
jgi:hypothetical protein